MRRFIAAFAALVLIFSLAGCAASDTYQYKSKDGDWSLKIPKEFVKDKEESNEELKSYTITYKTENESVLVINEMIDEKLVINEEKLKEEIAEGNYLHAESYDTIEINGFGKIYGALISDEAIGTSMLYYRLKHKDKAISFILYRQGSFTKEQISRGKEMIKTFKISK